MFFGTGKRFITLVLHSDHYVTDLWPHPCFENNLRRSYQALKGPYQALVGAYQVCINKDPHMPLLLKGQARVLIKPSRGGMLSESPRRAYALAP